jgi:hypothetical protein
MMARASRRKTEPAADEPALMKAMGWRPDMPDIRDHLFAAAPGIQRVLPPSASIAPSTQPPIQDQGLYAGINSLRALGLDSKVPLLFVIGQFGREFSNLGGNPRDSKRRVVFMLEPLLETLGVPYWRLEGPDDMGNVEAAWKSSRERSGPAALIVGHFVGW